MNPHSIVIFVPFAHGRPVGTPEDVLTGFVDGEGNALGRSVGVARDRAGTLLVADDVGNARWRVAARQANVVITPGVVQAVAATGQQRDPLILQQGCTSCR